MTMDTTDARQALDQITETKRALAQRSAAPRGYYAVLGLAMAILTATTHTPRLWSIVGIAVALVLIGVSVVWYRSAVGTWAWGDLRGKGSWTFWIMASIGVGCVVISMLVDSVPLGVGLGVLTLCAWSILGPMWDRAYVAQMQERK